MSTSDGGLRRVCSVCGQASVIRQGNQHLCEKHYRFGQMRANAKRNNKSVPSRSELENMRGHTLVCPDCSVQMNWLAKNGQATVATLQHYRDGSTAIVCRSCNTRHAFMPGDSFRHMAKDHKHCPSCKNVKPLTEFTLDSSRQRYAKRKSLCRDCSGLKLNQWRKTHREQYNAKQREYRARRKAQGNPVRSGS